MKEYYTNGSTGVKCIPQLLLIKGESEIKFKNCAVIKVEILYSDPHLNIIFIHPLVFSSQVRKKRGALSDPYFNYHTVLSSLICLSCLSSLA